jgi:hypothetical protein
MLDTSKSTRPLTATQVAELRDYLRDELRRLAPDPSGTPGAGSAELDRRGQELRDRILGALERVEAGTYGLCYGCGEPIPYSRLAAVPETLTCIDCAWRRPGSRER